MSNGEFSFDLYPGLDVELDAALERNINNGNADPGVVAIGLGAAVASAMPQSPNTMPGLPKAEWMKAGIEAAIPAFNKYADVSLNGDFTAPIYAEIEAEDVDFSITTNRLFHTRERLIAAAIKNPRGELVGESMKIVLIPWQGFRNHLHDLPETLKTLREQQGINTGDVINGDINAAIKDGAPLYESIVTDGRHIRAEAYLEERIVHDGPWGVGLMQTSNVAGVDNLVDKSADELTSNGTRGLHIGDATHLSSMGIFEWLAFTLQEDPRQLSSKDFSMLLGCHFDASGKTNVPWGWWSGNTVQVDQYSAAKGNNVLNPRLAIL